MGYAHPDHLLEQLTSVQWSEWLAWGRIRGTPEERADYRSGQVCAVLANIHRTERTEAFGPGDFVPQVLEDEALDEPENVSEDDMIDLDARSRELAAVFGKRGT